MTNHPNRGWRSRWYVQGRDARHLRTGLLIRFDPHPWGGWYSTIVNHVQVLAALREAGSRNPERALERYHREARMLFENIPSR